MEFTFLILHLLTLGPHFMVHGSQAADTPVDEYFTLDFLNSTKDLEESFLRAAFWNPDLIRIAKLWRNFPPHSFSQTIYSSPERKHLEPSKGVSVKNRCSQDLKYTLSSLKSTWALQLIDSFAKPPSGILYWNVRWLGNYNECLNVSAPANSMSQGFKGRYAWISFKLEKYSKFDLQRVVGLGACLPSSCAEDNNISKLYLYIIKFLENLPFVRKFIKELPDLSITFVPEKIPLSTLSVVCICICGVFMVLLLLGSLVDVLKRWKVSQPHGAAECEQNTCEEEDKVIQENGSACSEEEKRLASSNGDHAAISRRSFRCLVQGFLLCFSAPRNSETIGDTSSQGQIQCLHGIRFFTLAWIMFLHTALFGILAYENLKDLLDLLNSGFFQFGVQGSFAADTFFLMSGCLLGYVYLKNENSMAGIKHWLQFYAHRYIRLTPLYAMSIFIFVTWWKSLGSGPFWTTEYADKCSTSWWRNLLYINNFSGLDDMCMGWCWYLANEMQFFVISPLFLLAFRRSRAIGLLVVGLLLLGSWITAGIISKENNLPVMFEGLSNFSFSNAETFLDKHWKLVDKLYDKPYTRIGPYLIGVILGCLLHEVKGRQKFLNKFLVTLGWLASQTLSLVLLYGMWKVQLGPITESAINALSRTAWAISVAWVIFACHTGHGGPVNTLLSWKAWIPLSRLTYCVYLIHPMVIMWYFNNMKATYYVTISLAVLHCLSFMVLTYGVAFVASLMFEVPFIKLGKLAQQF